MSVTHRLDTVRQSGDETEHGLSRGDVPHDKVRRTGRLTVDFVDRQLHSRVGRSKLGLNRRHLRLDRRDQRVLFVAGNDKRGECLARDRVVRAAPLEPREPKRNLEKGRPQRTRQERDGVAPLQVDVTAGVTSLQPLEGNRDGDVTGIGRRRRHRERQLTVAAPCTPHVEDPLLFRVEVDELPPLQQ